MLILREIQSVCSGHNQRISNILPCFITFLTRNLYLAIHFTNASGLSVLRVERKPPNLLVFQFPCYKHLYQFQQKSDSPAKLQSSRYKWKISFKEVSTHLTTIGKRRSFQTSQKLFRAQWALIRLTETLTFIHGGLNEN